MKIISCHQNYETQTFASSSDTWDALCWSVNSFSLRTAQYIGGSHPPNFQGLSSLDCTCGVLANPLTLAVAPGSKSVNLEAADFDFSDRAFKNRELACTAFAHLFLNPLQRSRRRLRDLSISSSPRCFRRTRLHRPAGNT